MGLRKPEWPGGVDAEVVDLVRDGVCAGEDEFLDLSVFTNMTENIPGARSIRLPEMTHSPSPFESQLAQASWALAKEVDAKSDSAAG